MNRLYVLVTVMVVMVLAFFFGHEALAKVLAGTGGEDTLVGTDRVDRLKARRGADRLQGNRGADHLWDGRGNDKIVPGEGDDEVYAGDGDDLIYARDTEGVDYIDCGAGFDKVETIHLDDDSRSNCERALAPAGVTSKVAVGSSRSFMHPRSRRSTGGFAREEEEAQV